MGTVVRDITLACGEGAWQTLFICIVNLFSTFLRLSDFLTKKSVVRGVLIIIIEDVRAS